MFLKRVRVFQSASVTELNEEVNSFLLDLLEEEVDDNDIKLHLATDNNYSTIMVEWLEEGELETDLEQEGGENE